MGTLPVECRLIKLFSQQETYIHSFFTGIVNPTSKVKRLIANYIRSDNCFATNFLTDF